MKNAIVVTKKKIIYAPMADAMRKTCNETDIDFKNRKDNLKSYDNVILFDTKIARLNKPIRIGEHTQVGWWMNDLRSIEALHCEGELNPDIKCIFLCNTEYLEDYKEKFNIPVYYMPQHGHQYPTLAGRSFNGNIIFIGNDSQGTYHYNRKDILQALRKYDLIHLKGERVSIDMGYLYRKTPISLSISLPIKEYNSNRLYNILASQGFALVAYCPGMEKQFTNKKHLVWFKSIEEAVDLAQYYLNRPRERSKIAAKGYKLFTQKHMAKHRLQNMVDIMEGKTKEFYGYL